MGVRSGRPSRPAGHSAAPARQEQARGDLHLEQFRKARAAAVRTLLAARSTAILRRNRTAFLATIDPAASAFRSAQVRMFAHLAPVPLSSWGYVFDDQHDLSAPSRGVPSYAPESMLLRYRLRGFDVHATALPVYFTFVLRSGHWLVAADNDFAKRGLQTSRELWDYGPVVVARGRSSLALGHPDSAGLLAGIVAEADRDVPRVDEVWGTDWSRRVVIIVPSSQSELARVSGNRGNLAQIAAVATAELPGDSAHNPVGDRVLVNPPNFAKLGPLGREVVVTHEITHVATRQATGEQMPTWLVEGFADYVGYHGTDIPVAVAARELATEVRAGKLPRALPTDAEFAGSNPRLPQAYEEAWLACRRIAEQDGVAALARFYRVVGAAPVATAGQALDAGLRQVLHTTPEAFVAAWRGYVESQLA